VAFSDTEQTPRERASQISWLRAASRRKKLLTSAILTTLFCGAVLGVIIPNRFTATAVLLPPLPNGSISGAALMSQANTMSAIAAASGLMKNPNDQQVSLLKSYTVESAVVQRFHLQSQYKQKFLSSACREFERHTKADSGIKDGLIRISVYDRDPRRAAELTNGWVEEYRKLVAALAVSEASDRRRFYEVQLATARADLANAEEALKETQQRTGVIDLEGQDRALLATAAGLRGEIAAKEVEITAMKQFASDRNPDLERAQEELASLQSQLGAMGVTNNRMSGDLVVPKGNVSQAALEYARALREVKYRATIVDLLGRQYEGARVDEMRHGSLVEVVDPAHVPERPSMRSACWCALIACILCVPLGFIATQIAEIASLLRRIYAETASLVETVETVWAMRPKPSSRDDD
jgi:tyrosine-protein kinase Etk/Wzc